MRISSTLKKLFPRQQRRPFKLFQIESSLQCGLMCVMCPWTELRPQAGTMSWDTFARILPYLPQAEAVDLTGGGEPLVQPRLVDMVRACKVNGCETGFSTNGVHLNHDTAAALVSAKLDWISISVDAATPERYERIRQGARFEMVMHNIAHLRELKENLKSPYPRMMMVFVMMAENYDELPDFIDLAHNLGAEAVIAKNLDVILKDGDDERRLFSHTGPPGAALQGAVQNAQKRAEKAGLRLRLYALQPQEQPVCEHNPLRSLFFNWQGEISPCITLAYAGERFFDGQRIQEPCLHFGNILENRLEDIWESPAYRSFRDAFRRRQTYAHQAVLQLFTGEYTEEVAPMPPAPQGCRTCYYLYGI